VSMYRVLVAGMAAAMILLGLGMVSLAIHRGGTVGYLLGGLFIAAGAGRLWMLRKRR
jgi:hypothetical protein